MRRIPLWAKILVPVLIVGGLGYLGGTIGRNTVGLDEVKAIQDRQEAAVTSASVAACRAVQHANQLQDVLIDIFATGTRASDPRVQDYIAKVTAVQTDTRLCDLAARRVGHPIRPYPIGTLPDNR